MPTDCQGRSVYRFATAPCVMLQRQGYAYNDTLPFLFKADRSSLPSWQARRRGAEALSVVERAKVETGRRLKFKRRTP